MTIESSCRRVWWQWVLANSIAELLGLGTVAVLGFLVASNFGEPHGLFQSISFAALFIVLGAFEGLVVGLAQSSVLQRVLPDLRGWVQATVLGATVAWALGMVPSSIMSIMQPTEAAHPAELNDALGLLLAAGLGLSAGPLLAFFQWRLLRHYVARHSALWLPANAAAWALGMPVIFLSMDIGELTTNPLIIILGVGLSLLAAGAIVGAVHGRVLIWLLSADTPGRSCK